MCFRLLQEAGYRIVPKGEMLPAEEETDLDRNEIPPGEYPEGAKVLKQHVSRERTSLRRLGRRRRTSSEGTIACSARGVAPIPSKSSAQNTVKRASRFTTCGGSGGPHDCGPCDPARGPAMPLCYCHRFVHRMPRRGLPLPSEGGLAEPSMSAVFGHRSYPSDE